MPNVVKARSTKVHSSMEVVSERSKRKNPRAPHILTRGRGDQSVGAGRNTFKVHKNDGDVGRGTV